MTTPFCDEISKYSQFILGNISRINELKNASKTLTLRPRSLLHAPNQSRSQSLRSSVGGIVGLWEKAKKNARNSLHFITIGSSILGKRTIFKLLNDKALAKS